MEAGCLSGRGSKTPASARKSVWRTSGLREVIAVVSFLRWFADREVPCLVCGKMVEEGEYLALYRPEPTEAVVAINAGHASCRLAENAKRVRRAESPCGCTVVTPTLVRVVSCGGEAHEVGTVQASPISDEEGP